MSFSLSSVRDTARFLVEIMQVAFILATVGDSWRDHKRHGIPLK